MDRKPTIETIAAAAQKSGLCIKVTRDRLCNTPGRRGNAFSGMPHIPLYWERARREPRAPAPPPAQNPGALLHPCASERQRQSRRRRRHECADLEGPVGEGALDRQGGRGSDEGLPAHQTRQGPAVAWPPWQAAKQLPPSH